MIFKNKELHKKVKEMADNIYLKNSAYKSGYIVKKYKDLGGEFNDNIKEKPLKRWFSEKWINLNEDKELYPLYRPTIRINDKTPLIVSEISKSNLKKQSKLKQKIRGSKNLPKFIKK